MVLTLALYGLISLGIDRRPIRVELAPNAVLTLYPEEQGGDLKMRLAIRKGKHVQSKSFHPPITFQCPDHVIASRYGLTNTWLVLGTEGTREGDASFCLAVDLHRPNVKVLFTDQEGVESSKGLLKRGGFHQSDLAKWIFVPTPGGPRRSGLWSRVGKFDLQKNSVAFGPWKKAAS